MLGEVRGYMSHSNITITQAPQMALNEVQMEYEALGNQEVVSHKHGDEIIIKT